MKNSLTSALLISASILTACGGGGGGGGGGVADTQTGSFINSPTKGIKYVATPSGLSGTTDENGSYSYKSGDTVSFTLNLGGATVSLGSTTSPSASTSVLSLTPPTGGDPLVVAQVLETLDKSVVDGKMDVSDITLPAGSLAITNISNALTSQSLSSANIATIATAVHNVLTTTNTGSLKFGSSGVTSNDALVNLSKNSANQTYLDTKVKNMSWDGSSTILNFQDKTAYTSWIIKSGGVVTTANRIGVMRSSLTYEHRSPYNATSYMSMSGTYTLSNSNRTGNWTGNGITPNSGTFEVISSETNSFSARYQNITTTETGTFVGSYLLPLTLNDIKSKTFTIYKGCPDGSNGTVTFSSSAVGTANCGLSINGITWSAGPFTNTLQYTDANGKVHYGGLIRLEKNGGTGNLPSGAVGAMVNLYSTGDTSETYKTLSETINFKVN